MAKTKVSPTEVQSFLMGLDYPATKDAIIDYAQEEGVNEDVIATLERITDREYEGVSDLNEEIVKIE